MKKWLLLPMLALASVCTLSVAAKKPPFAYHAPDPKAPLEAPTVAYGSKISEKTDRCSVIKKCWKEI